MRIKRLDDAIYSTLDIHFDKTGYMLMTELQRIKAKINEIINCINVKEQHGKEV